MSYRSLCLKDTKPPFLQLIQCWTLNLLPQEHVVGKFAILHPYRKRIASQKCCFDSLKPKSLISSAVSQYYPPIRLRNCDFSRKSWVTIWFLHPWKLNIDFIFLVWCCHTCPGILKLLLNNKLSISRERVYWIC